MYLWFTIRIWLRSDESFCAIVTRALLSNNNKIPAERLKLLEEEVKIFYGVQELDESLLQEATELDTK